MRMLAGGINKKEQELDFGQLWVLFVQLDVCCIHTNHFGQTNLLFLFFMFRETEVGMYRLSQIYLELQLTTRAIIWCQEI